MPIAPPPRRMQCAHCGHRWLFAPASDVLLADPRRCPRCSHGPVRSEPLPPGVGQVARWLGRLLGRDGR